MHAKTKKLEGFERKELLSLFSRVGPKYLSSRDEVIKSFFTTDLHAVNNY